MQLHHKLRGRTLAPMLVVIAAIASGLLGPSAASAMRDASHSERHSVRLEERLARRAQHQIARKTLRSEREARQSLRAQRRATKRLARQERGHEGKGGEDALPQGGSCQVTITAGSTRVLAGESVAVSGAATCPAQLAAAVPHVQIYERTAGSGLRAASLMQALPAESDGSYTMTSGPLTANTVFQARLGGARARVVVKVAPAITLVATPESSSSAGTAARTRRSKTHFSGTVTPGVVGRLVALQISSAATGEQWHSIAWTHTDALGAYTIDHVLRTPGATNVRTIVHPGSHLGLGVSKALSLQGVQPQRAALTINASADPVVAGQVVQIYGVAAAGADTPVKLLARPAGGSWAVLGETTTDEAGGFSFEEMPPETTVYRAIDARAKSTPLKVSVAFAISPETPPATAIAGETVTFGGTVAPAAAGTLVALEMLGPGGAGFHPIATGTIGAAQEYAINYAFLTAGQYSLRVRAFGNGAHSSAAVTSFVLNVTG